MGHITDALLNLHGPVIYAVVAALVFAEAALFFGFVFPGETAIVVGGVLASQHRVSLPVLLVVIALAAVTGDSTGYEIGRRFGDRILDAKALSKHRDKVAKAQDLLRRRGALAVFIGRFTAVLRAMMPALAGSARMPYPGSSSSTPSAASRGAGATPSAATSRARRSSRSPSGPAGSLVFVAALAVVAIVVWSVRRKRRAAPATEPAEPVAESRRRPLTAASDVPER